MGIGDEGRRRIGGCLQPLVAGIGFSPWTGETTDGEQEASCLSHADPTCGRAQTSWASQRLANVNKGRVNRTAVIPCGSENERNDRIGGLPIDARAQMAWLAG
jgi:hypothetical protein